MLKSCQEECVPLKKLVNWNISKTSKVHNVCLSSCLHFVLSPVCYYQINLLSPVFPSTLIITALLTLKNNSINILLIQLLHLLCQDSNYILKVTPFDAFSSTCKQLWSSFISANNHYTYQDWQKRQRQWHTFMLCRGVCQQVTSSFIYYDSAT